MRLIDADTLFAEIKGRHDMFADCEYIGDKARRDELSSFMADIVNAPTIGGWISVKDRLPEQYEKTFRGILARSGEEIVKTRIVSDEVLVSYLNKYGRRKIGISYMLDGEWSGMFRSLAEIDVFTKAITHWQPLPEMPEEEENDG